MAHYNYYLDKLCVAAGGIPDNYSIGVCQGSASDSCDDDNQYDCDMNDDCTWVEFENVVQCTEYSQADIILSEKEINFSPKSGLAEIKKLLERDK